MEEDPAGAVIHRIDQRTLDVRDGVVRTVEKVEHRLREQRRILPALLHVAVETDITGEHDGRGRFRHRTSLCKKKKQERKSSASTVRHRYAFLPLSGDRNDM